MSLFDIFKPKRLPTLFSDTTFLAEPPKIKLPDSPALNSLSKEQRASLEKIPKIGKSLIENSEEDDLYHEFLSNFPFYQPVNSVKFENMCESYYVSLCMVQDLKSVLIDMRLYVQHSPECVVFKKASFNECSCGLIHLLEKYKLLIKGRDKEPANE